MSHTENGKVVCQSSFIGEIRMDTVWKTHPFITIGSCNKMKTTVTAILSTEIFFAERRHRKKANCELTAKLTLAETTCCHAPLDGGDSSVTDVKRHQRYSRTEGQSKWRKDETASLHLNCATVTKAQCIPIFNLPVSHTHRLLFRGS